MKGHMKKTITPEMIEAWLGDEEFVRERALETLADLANGVYELAVFIEDVRSYGEDENGSIPASEKTMERARKENA